MTTENISLFTAMSAKMRYLDQRQKLISQNVANANTPGYAPMDLKEVDFGRVLTNVTRSNQVRPATTQPGHMPAPNAVEDARSGKMRHTYEVAPAGNAVVIEEQMVNANAINLDYNLMTSLYQKNVGMIKTALGRGG